MDRLISEQAVIKILILLFIGNKNFKVAINSIKTIPSAEPKTGYWILGICDNCGYDWGKDAPIASVPNFCPNCGAKMVDEQERSEI